jgi:hypothetical protein
MASAREGGSRTISRSPLRAEERRQGVLPANAPQIQLHSLDVRLFADTARRFEERLAFAIQEAGEDLGRDHGGASRVR